MAATNASFPLNDRYAALDAYKFDVPNGETTLPGSTCTYLHTDRDQQRRQHLDAPKALAELAEGLGGAVVATHSQSGSVGHHLVRILKEHGEAASAQGL